MDQDAQKTVQRHKDELASVKGTTAVSDEKQTAERIRQQLRDLMERKRDWFKETAEKLYQMSRNARYMYIDNPETGEKYSSFEEFCKFELDFGKRKAQKLARVWEWYTVENSEDFFDTFASLGWTKMDVLVDEIDPENAEDVKEEISNMSTSEIKDWIKERNKDEKDKKDPVTEERTNKEKQETETKRKTFEVDEQQENTIDTAKEIAEKATGNKQSESDALELICSKFISENTDLSDDPNAERTILQRIEDNLGVSLLAEEGGEIVHGDIDRFLDLFLERYNREEVLSRIEDYYGEEFRLVGIHKKSGIMYGHDAIDELESEEEEVEKVEEEMVL